MIFRHVLDDVDLPHDIPEIPDDYCIPTKEQIKGLRIEVIILIIIYFITICFVLHNMIRYLWFQGKYRVF